MVFLNNGTGTPFTQNGYTVVGSSSSDADDNTTSVALADVTGNGRADLVEGISGGPSKLFLSNGTSTPFSSAGIALGTGGDTDMTTLVVLANVTGHANGLPDLILGNDGQPDRLFVNSGDANPFDGTPYNIGDGTDDTTCLAVADVNGDGKPDLVRGQRRPAELRLPQYRPRKSVRRHATDDRRGRQDDAGRGDRQPGASGHRPDVVFGYPGEVPQAYVNNGTSSPWSGVDATYITPETELAGAVDEANDKLFDFSAMAAVVSSSGQADITVGPGAP